MKHKHHIIPRHAGGTDDPSNLVELTIEEHAEAHRILYEKYGKTEDKVAWQALAGLIPKEHIMRDLHQVGRKKADKSIMEKYGVSNPGQLPHNKLANSERMKKLHASGDIPFIKFHNRPDYLEILEKAKSPESITKRKNSFVKIKHQQGVNNSQFGTMWITDGKTNKKILTNADIPQGCYKGRVCKK